MNSAARLQQATDLLFALNRFNEDALTAMPVIAQAKQRAMAQFVLAAKVYVSETPPRDEREIRDGLNAAVATLRERERS